MASTRRDFVIGGLTAGAAAPVLGKTLPVWAAGGQRAADTIVVYIQCRGGYDYLNTLIPPDDPVYYQSRPNIGIPKASTLGEIESGVPIHWHPALQGFKDLFDRGDLAIVHNVGYPNPNQSHFESEKKWASADPASVVLAEGWLCKYLNVLNSSEAIPALDIESRLAGAFVGCRPPVLTDINTFQFTSDPRPPSGADAQAELALMKAQAALVPSGAHHNLLYIAGGIPAAFDDSALLRNTGTGYTPRATYPAQSRLANDLQVAARLISGGLKCRLYYTNFGGFDHHANEVNLGAPTTGRLADLLAELSDNIKALLDDLKAWGTSQNVLVAVSTEFGRRDNENGSLGSDHGHGGVAFLAGEGVNAGQYGNYPYFSGRVDPNDPSSFIPFDANSTDFRSFYREILERWLGVAPVDLPRILGAGNFPLLGAI